MKRMICLSLSLGLLAGATALAATAAETLAGFDAKIARLSKPGTSVNAVIQLLGEPEQYVWGEKTFTRANLPPTYILLYPQGIHVVVSRGLVTELRSESPGPGFTWHDKLRLGLSLEEALAVLGPPAQTLEGKPPAFAPNVLYKDSNGEKGYCYYSRPDQHIRLFFRDYKVSALYVAVTGGEPGEKFTIIRPIKEVKEYDDVRFKDMSKLDLSASPGLPATLWFNQKTVWPKGIDTSALVTSAMNPGLGVRGLHRDGLTGKGVNVAIIDQPLYQDHPEFEGKIAAYHDVGCNSESSMHGPGVTSLLVGSKCGTAPGARVYFAAAPSWTQDTAYQAKALDWIVEQNARLAPADKIRVVSVSGAPSGPGSPFKKNTELWDPACQRAAKAGILVLDCTEHHGFIGPCYYDAADPENLAKCKPGFPGMPAWGAAKADQSRRVLVPCSPRTTAEEYDKGQCGYQYCGRGGLSWSIPYCAGVLALGWEARPELTAQQMRELLFKSAHRTADGWLIINPPEFIRLVKAQHS
jgi:serine protease AprX